MKRGPRKVHRGGINCEFSFLPQTTRWPDLSWLKLPLCHENGSRCSGAVTIASLPPDSIPTWAEQKNTRTYNFIDTIWKNIWEGNSQTLCLALKTVSRDPGMVKNNWSEFWLLSVWITVLEELYFILLDLSFLCEIRVWAGPGPRVLPAPAGYDISTKMGKVDFISYLLLS